MYLYLLHLDVPRLARCGRGEAIFQQMVALYVKVRERTLCARIAAYVGGKQRDKLDPEATDEVDLNLRSSQLFQEVSADGAQEVTIGRLLEWLRNIGVSADEHKEVAAIFAHFDQNDNGMLDEEETTNLLKFILNGNSLVTSSLTLRTASVDALSMLAQFDWNQIIGDETEAYTPTSVAQEGREGGPGDSLRSIRSFFSTRSKSGKVSIEECSYRLTEARLKVAAHRGEGRLNLSGLPLSALQRRAKELGVCDELLSQSVDGDTLEAVKASIIELIQGHMPQPDACHHSSSSKLDPERERCMQIDLLIREGEHLMAKGIFSLPKLSWDAKEDEDQRRVLKMIGFLLDAYHKVTCCRCNGPSRPLATPPFRLHSRMRPSLALRPMGLMSARTTTFRLP